MTEILAENRYTLTKGLFLQGMLKTQYGNNRKVYMGTLTIISAAWLFLLYIAVSKGQGYPEFIMESIAAALACLYILYLQPKNAAKKNYEKLCERYDQQMERTIRLYEDHLQVKTMKDELDIAYEEIEKMVRNIDKTRKRSNS